jgi:hypothetical protein
MKKSTFLMTSLAFMITGCAWTPPSKNPNIEHNSEKQAYQSCLKKNGGDKSKCNPERQKYLERQEMELMDNNG